MPVQDKVKKIIAETLTKHKLTEKNDKILIAFSGGKDSYVMLDVLLSLLKNSPVKYDLFPVIIDSGFNADYSKAEHYLKKRKITYLIKKTKIADIVKSKLKKQKNTGNYCFMCSRLRRGVLYKIAKENNCNKLALGHNLDDSIETFLLNMFFVSKLEAMKAKYKSKDNLIVIRPMINVPENLIIEYAKEKKFSIVKQKCLLEKKDSKREMIKNIIKRLSEKNKNFYSSMSNVMNNI